ncbi:glycosyl hydrolase [Halioxenophilus aromaticivorans]|uniref:Beta-mannosidase-like galactose-binding domain-containing protein n=1 Tax=Halioxenophilus aromaticivorans TaxID=1306992 RepID=A0AAV3U3M1_9ALTE
MKNTRCAVKAAAFICATGGLLLPATAQLSESTDVAAGNSTLWQEFQNPPHQAKPHTWWHWLSGNVDNANAAKDLQWMSDIGLGGLQQFNAHLGSPTIVDAPVGYLSEAWQESFSLALARAKQLNLDYAIAASPGWSQTGGPWVEEKDGMKKLVWSRTLVSGASNTLAPLPSVSGPFQNVPFHDPLSGQAHSPYQYAKPIVALAMPWAHASLPAPQAVDAQGETLDSAALLDDDFESNIGLPLVEGEAASIEYRYPQAVSVQASRIYIPNAVPPFGQPKYLPKVQAKIDGQWQTLAQVALSEAPTTVSFDPVTAQEFRLLFSANPVTATAPSPGVPGAVRMNVFKTGGNDALPVAQWQLFNEPRVHRAESKAGFSLAPDYYALVESGGELTGIAAKTVIDITGAITEDGELTWQPPQGETWLVLQMGYSLTGKTNHPAAKDATGLEVDKLDAQAVRRYIETYLSLHQEALGGTPLKEAGVTGMLNDSIEVGPANWTPQMLQQFKHFNGYDLLPWLPALTGLVVETRQQTEQFLYDFRQTLVQLLATEHYKTVAEVAHEHGLQVYGEALENGRPVLGDDIAMRSYADVPMAALWAYPHGGKPQPTAYADLKGAASVAHVYGRTVVAAESMTSMYSPWAMGPADLKHIADQEFVDGINRPIIHTSIHQPREDLLPGLSLAVFGQYFNRFDTWAAKAKPWIDYLSRSSYLLQQGHYVADIAYFYGEEAPLTSQFQAGLGDQLPSQYRYDFVNAQALADALVVDHGKLVNKSGNAYSVLYLGGSSHTMTLATLKLIAKRVKQGATLVGAAPTAMPGLNSNNKAFNRLVNRLWKNADVTRYGKGRVYNSKDLTAALEQLKIAPDFSYQVEGDGQAVEFLHRRSADADIYFVTNRSNKPVHVNARFRTTGAQPELWHAEFGQAHQLDATQTQHHTQVLLQFAPEEAYFVVFPKQAVASRELKRPEKTLLALNNPWEVVLTDPFGQSLALRFASLMPLNESGKSAVRYFSGNARYRTEFDVPNGLDTEQPIWLDLGKVGDLAEVWINGEALGVDWMPPMRLQVNHALKPGRNTLEVEVTNLWVNRLIGDQRPNIKKATFTALPTYEPSAPLREAGLIGPVTLVH